MNVLFSDEYMVAVDKPVELMVHASSRSQDTTFLLPRLCEQLGRRLYPVHRLDRATSGVLLLATSREAAGALGRAFQARRVSKFYIALVRGWMPASGVMDRPLSARAGQRAQDALTRFRSVARVELPFAVGRYATSRYSLVMLKPHTGRTHQLRRHLKQAFHPIVGDTTYGEGRHNRFFRIHYGVHRMLLHARSLGVPHPVTGDTVRIQAPLPEAFRRLMTTWSGLTAARDPTPDRISTG